MSLGLIMPGQGSQKIGMGLDFLNSGPSKNIYNKSRALLDWDLLDLIEKGPIEKLSNTKYCQPAIYTVSCAISNNLKDKQSFKAVSGHSLGQFAAAFFSGVFTFEEGLELVIKRAELMDEFSNSDLGMAAILGLEPVAVKEIVAAYSDLYCANFNSAQQTVISGPVKSLDRSAEAFLRKGARKFVKLSVSGAFHSPYMEKANKRFANYLDNTTFAQPTVPVVSNIDGRLLSDAQAVKSEFISQMTSSVDWISVINSFADAQAGTIAELGPGNILTGFSKRIRSDISFVNIDSMNALKEFSRELS